MYLIITVNEHLPKNEVNVDNFKVAPNSEKNRCNEKSTIRFPTFPERKNPGPDRNKYMLLKL